MKLNEKQTPDHGLIDFNIHEAHKLVESFYVFFKEKYNFILPQKANRSIKKELPDNLIPKFKLKTSQKPIYEELNGASDVQALLEEIQERATEMIYSIDDISQDYETELQGNEAGKAIIMVSSIVQKFGKTLNYRAKKINIENATTLNEVQFEFFQFLSQILKDNLIERVIPPIFAGMQSGYVEIYDMILGKIYRFLSSLGVYTIDIEVGQKVSYDYCIPSVSNENITDDYKLKEIIKTIEQLPYVFDEDHPVVEGKVIVWRFSNG